MNVHDRSMDRSVGTRRASICRTPLIPFDASMPRWRVIALLSSLSTRHIAPRSQWGPLSTLVTGTVQSFVSPPSSRRQRRLRGPHARLHIGAVEECEYTLAVTDASACPTMVATSTEVRPRPGEHRDSGVPELMNREWPSWAAT